MVLAQSQLLRCSLLTQRKILINPLMGALFLHFFAYMVWRIDCDLSKTKSLVRDFNVLRSHKSSEAADH